MDYIGVGFDMFYYIRIDLYSTLLIFLEYC